MKRSVNRILNIFFAWDIIAVIWFRLKVYCKRAISIGWQNAYHDLIAVTRGLWFFSLFQVFGALAFVLLSQGKDVLQCLLEDVYGKKYIPFFILLAGTWFWSLASEFGSRMLLYLTNSSNDGITPERKKFRRRTQNMIPLTQAVFPFLLYIYALTKTFLTHEKDVRISTAFAFLLGALILNLKWALHFYMGKNRSRNTYFVPPLGFQREAIGNLGNILVRPQSTLSRFPGQIKPEMYEDINGTAPPEIRLFFRRAFSGFYKWSMIYFSITVILFALVGFVFSDKVHYVMGTAGILAIGFTCWLISFFSVKIFELTKPFEGRLKPLNLPYTSILLAWLLICSYANNDHPVSFKTEKCCALKPNLGPKEFFYAWYDKHRRFSCRHDTAICSGDPNFDSHSRVCYSDSFSPKRIVKVPVVFIAAEGGALRTGCFTSMLLAAIQDSFPCFKDRIFAYSTVSGGSFGANLFNVMTDEKNRRNDSLLPLYKNYYESVDFLAPVAAKLFFGDFIGYFIPSYIEKLDREVALETSWRNSWRDYLSHSEDNLLYNDFYYSAKTDGNKAAVLINSTVAETGHRAIISNMRLDTVFFRNVFDLNQCLHDNISYATAISLSARFPLVSPSGKVQLDDSHKVHLVDGGYFDNQGGTTMRELLNALSFDPSRDSIQVLPFVIQTVFDAQKQADCKGVSMFNEITDIVAGIYQTRNGHTVYANDMLKQKIREMGGRYLELPVASTTEDVPNNWILSTFAVENTYKRVRNLLRGTREKELDMLPKFLAACCVDRTGCRLKK